TLPECSESIYLSRTFSDLLKLHFGTFPGIFRIVLKYFRFFKKFSNSLQSYLTYSIHFKNVLQFTRIFSNFRICYQNILAFKLFKKNSLMLNVLKNSGKLQGFLEKSLMFPNFRIF